MSRESEEPGSRSRESESVDFFSVRKNCRAEGVGSRESVVF